MTDDVIISGTNWRPEVHGAEYYHKEIMKLLDNPNVTDRAVKTGLWLMRSQIFKDGNKRIGSFAINKILIENGKGIFKVPVELDGTFKQMLATVYKGNIIKNLIMDCQSYTKYRPNETTGGIFVSWRRKEELPTGA